MKFRKKPVVIEAVQFLEGQPIPRGVCFKECDSLYKVGTNPHLHTIHLNQIVQINFGDWVIPEPDSEHFYPCKPDIFAATYEPCEED